MAGALPVDVDTHGMIAAFNDGNYNNVTTFLNISSDFSLWGVALYFGFAFIGILLLGVGVWALLSIKQCADWNFRGDLEASTIGVHMAQRKNQATASLVKTFTHVVPRCLFTGSITPFLVSNHNSRNLECSVYFTRSYSRTNKNPKRIYAIIIYLLIIVLMIMLVIAVLNFLRFPAQIFITFSAWYIFKFLFSSLEAAFNYFSDNFMEIELGEIVIYDGKTYIVDSIQCSGLVLILAEQDSSANVRFDVPSSGVHSMTDDYNGLLVNFNGRSLSNYPAFRPTLLNSCVVITFVSFTDMKAKGLLRLSSAFPVGDNVHIDCRYSSLSYSVV